MNKDNKRTKDWCRGLGGEAKELWITNMLMSGVPMEKIQSWIRDGTWHRLKKDWIDIYCNELEDDLRMERGQFRSDEDEDEINERGEERWKEHEAWLRKKRIEEKLEVILSKKEPADIFK